MKEKKTFLQWLDNYWYHYKWWTIFAVFLLVVVGSGIYFSVTDTKYDYNITYVTYSPISMTQMNEFEDEIKKYAEDVDGNGEINLNIQYYNMGIIFEDPNGYAANVVGLQDDINHVKSTIFVVDKEAFDFIQKNYKCFGNQDGTYADQTMDMDAICWAWEGTALKGKLRYYGFPDELFFAVRTPEKTKYDGVEKVEKRTAASLVMLEKIKAANPHEESN